MNKHELKQRLSVPVIGAPLFIVSNPDLVVAQCKAGIVGAFPALNARPQQELEVWLQRITSELDAWNQANPERPAAPFAVNQIVHKSNSRLEHDLEMTVRYKVPIVITSLGARTDLNDAVHSYGGMVLHDVINQRFAHKAIEKGADGLILVAAGAGGHAGVQSPFALVQETRRWFDGPIALSGAIATGRAVLAAGSNGRGLRVHRLRLHRNPRSQRVAGLQTGTGGRIGRRHRLQQPVHRRARQLPTRVDRERGTGSGQPAQWRSEQDELRQRRQQGSQGLEGHLGLRPGHRRYR
jgi:hypothetical protein